MRDASPRPAIGLTVTVDARGDYTARLDVPGFDPLVLGTLSAAVKRIEPESFDRWVAVLGDFVRGVIDRCGGTVTGVREFRASRDN